MIKKIRFILLIITMSMFLISCSDNSKIETLSTNYRIVDDGEIYTVQCNYYVYPSNINNIKIEWSVNNNEASIDENGLFTTRSLKGSYVVTCKELKSGLENEFTINVSHNDEYSTLWKNNRDFNHIENINDANMKKFVDKYPNSLVYSTEMIELIKESESVDLEFIQVINELEKTYFSKKNLEEKLYIFCKVKTSDLGECCYLDVSEIIVSTYKYEGFSTLYPRVTVKLLENSSELYEEEYMYYCLEINKNDYGNYFDYGKANSEVFYIGVYINFVNTLNKETLYVE